MRCRGKSDGPTENKTGTRPATPVSPDTSANDKEKCTGFAVPTRPTIDASEDRDGSRAPPLVPLQEDGSAEAEIEREFQGRLMGSRRLPRSQRAGACRAAREWRAATLKA